MKKLRTFMKYANILIICVIISVSIFAFYDRVMDASYERIPIVLSFIPILFAPFLVKHIFHYDMPLTLRFFYYTFAFLGLTLGSVLGFYNKISWFDLFVHTLSGFLTSLVALIFLKKIGLVTDNNLWFQVLFTICFSMAIAGVWEIFEFGCDKFFKADAQKVMESGVDDTMGDMIVATLGSIFYSIFYVFGSKKMSRKEKQKWLDLV